MSSQRISEIRARCDAATPGPWEYRDNGFDGGVYAANEILFGGEPCEGRIEPDDPNAAFIAHARTDIPYLLVEIERLTKEHNAMKQSCDGLRASHDNLYARLRELTARAEQAERERNTYKAALENWHEGADCSE